MLWCPSRKVSLVLGCLWIQEKTRGSPGTASPLLMTVDAPPHFANSLAHGSMFHPRQGQGEKLDPSETAYEWW